MIWFDFNWTALLLVNLTVCLSVSLKNLFHIFQLYMHIIWFNFHCCYGRNEWYKFLLSCVCPYSFFPSFRSFSQFPIPVFLHICLSFWIIYSSSFTLSLYLPILATLFLCTHLICFHCFSPYVLRIPSFHSFFPPILIS